MYIFIQTHTHTFNNGNHNQKTAGSDANQVECEINTSLGLRSTWDLKKQRQLLNFEKNVTNVFCVKPQIFIFHEKILKVCHSVHIFI